MREAYGLVQASAIFFRVHLLTCIVGGRLTLRRMVPTTFWSVSSDLSAYSPCGAELCRQLEIFLQHSEVLESHEIRARPAQVQPRIVGPKVDVELSARVVREARRMRAALYRT